MDSKYYVVCILIALLPLYTCLDSSKYEYKSQLYGKQFQRVLQDNKDYQSYKQVQTNQITQYDKVQVQLYFEALCPYCGNFITGALESIVNSSLVDIIDLKLVPWGNVYQDKFTDKYICQHGVMECKLNKAYSCLIQHHKLEKYYPIIACSERQPRDKRIEGLKACADEHNINFDIIQECIEGQEGEELQMKAKNETGSLNPQHSYVPWVVVNNKPLYDDIDNIKIIICKEFQGKQPQQCRDVNQRAQGMEVKVVQIFQDQNTVNAFNLHEIMEQFPFIQNSHGKVLIHNKSYKHTS